MAVTAPVTILKIVPVATIIGGTFTYNGTPRPATCTVAGINGDTFAGTISYAPVNAVPVNAGTVQATCSFAGNGNYEAAVAVTAPVTITKINATVTAGSGSKTYGAVDPALSSATTTGFIGTDGITTSQTRAAGENVGSYTVTAVATGAALVNYNVVSTPGTFSITRATVTVTAGGGNKVYGTADPALTATTQVGFLPGDVAGITLSSTRAAGNNVGSYATTPTASGGNIANYVITPVAGTFSITKATLIVTADNKTRPRGAFNPALTSTITGFVSGDTAAVVGGSAALSTTAVAASPAGTYPITASVGSLVAANYSFIFVGATLTVTPQINLPPTCGTATGGEIWPPNHKKFYAAPINGVRDPEGTFLTITVTGILQDEPIDSTGDGNFSPDGQGIGTGTAWVRAERNGHQNTAVGDGRVYEIFFSATDGVSLCTGSVFYTVPHDQGQRSTAIDSGVRFDSTGVIPGARDKSQIHQKSPTP